jgi:hypothetical protein
MKRQWKLHRQYQEARDGHTRWDRAYQCLLRWGSVSPPAGPPDHGADDRLTQEVHDASRGLCACVHATAGPEPDD